MATWQIIPERSSIRYRIRHLGFLWSRGSVAEPEGQVVLESDLTKTYIYTSVDVRQLASGSLLRDKALQGRRYFHVSEHPTASFVSYEVQQGKHPSRFIALGELSIKGISLPVRLPFRIVSVSEGQMEKVAHFKGGMEVERHAFGVGGGFSLLGKRVWIDVEIKARRV